MDKDLKTVLDFMLDYGEKGDLPNMDEGGSGEVAYAAALRLADLQTKIDWQCDDGICEHTDRVAGKCACYNKERVTEEQLLQKIYQAVANTGVTYKQIDCDLDEQGDMTIFFSGLDQETTDD